MTSRSLNRAEVRCKFDNFCSNDYLNITENHKLRDFVSSNSQIPIGSGSSRFINGNTEYHINLESQISKWTGAEKTICFNSAFAANYALVNHIASNKNSILIIDKLIHASFIEGIKASKIKFATFAHNNIEQLDKICDKHRDKDIYVAIESIYSMSGDIAKLSQIQQLKAKHRFHLIVDESHSIGLYGKEGAGLCNQYQIKPDILVFSFGKSIGSQGGSISGELKFIEGLTNNSNSLIYSTGTSPLICAATSYAIDLIKKMNQERRQLQAIQEYAIEKLKSSNFKTSSQSQIIPVSIDNDQIACALQQHLLDLNIYCKAIFYPTVPKGKSIIRVSLTAKNIKVEIDRLINSIKSFFNDQQ